MLNQACSVLNAYKPADHRYIRTKHKHYTVISEQ